MSEFIALSSCIDVTESFLETNFFLANIYQLSVYCLERGLNKVQTQIVNLIINNMVSYCPQQPVQNLLI